MYNLMQLSHRNISAYFRNTRAKCSR